MGDAAGTLGLVLLIGVFAWLLREGPPRLPREDSAARTADGWTFVPDGDAVQIVPPGTPEEVWPVKSRTVLDFTQIPPVRSMPVHPRTGRWTGSWLPGERLRPGDLVAARAVRGADDAPWRLEALGRDGEVREWWFDGQDAASEALTLLIRRVVRAPWLMPPSPASDEAFDAARERALRSEHELGTLGPDDLVFQPRTLADLRRTR